MFFCVQFINTFVLELVVGHKQCLCTLWLHQGQLFLHCYTGNKCITVITLAVHVKQLFAAVQLCEKGRHTGCTLVLKAFAKIHFCVNSFARNN